MAQIPLTSDAKQTAQALAQLIETALAVDGAAWCAAIDDARTHRPIDRALDALACILGESPARWQGGLGYWPTDGGRGLLARAYAAIAASAVPCPTCGDTSCDGKEVRELRAGLTPATLPIEHFRATMRGPVVQLVKGDPINAELTPQPDPAPAPAPAPVHVAAPSDDDVPW